MKLSPEERKERKRESNKRYLQNRTEEQKEERKVKRKESHKIRLQNRTEEQRKEQKEKKKEYLKRRYQNMTEEQRVERITTHPLIEPISKITFCNIINLQN